MSYENDNGARALETFAAAEFWDRHASGLELVMVKNGKESLEQEKHGFAVLYVYRIIIDWKV